MMVSPTRYVPLCAPHRIDATTPLIPLTPEQYDGLVAVHGEEAASSMYAPEDSEVVELMRRISEYYIDRGAGLMARRVLAEYRRSLDRGGFDAAGFRRMAAELLGAVAQIEDTHSLAPSEDTDDTLTLGDE